MHTYFDLSNRCCIYIIHINLSSHISIHRPLRFWNRLVYSLLCVCSIYIRVVQIEDFSQEIKPLRFMREIRFLLEKSTFNNNTNFHFHGAKSTFGQTKKTKTIFFPKKISHRRIYYETSIKNAIHTLKMACVQCTCLSIEG